MQHLKLHFDMSSPVLFETSQLTIGSSVSEGARKSGGHCIVILPPI